MKLLIFTGSLNKKTSDLMSVDVEASTDVTLMRCEYKYIAVISNKKCHWLLNASVSSRSHRLLYAHAHLHTAEICMLLTWLCRGGWKRLITHCASAG